MKYSALFFLILSIIILLFSLNYYFHYSSILNQFSYPATITLSNSSIGFDINGTALTFGSIAIDGSSTRRVLITNTYSFPISVKTEVFGSISSLILDVPNLIIAPFNETHVPIIAYAGYNSNLSLGNYSGNVIFIIRRSLQKALK